MIASNSVLSPETAKLLREMVAEHATGKPVIEIGSWLGESARIIIAAGASRCHCIDTWLGSPEMRTLPEMPHAFERFCTNIQGLPIEPIRYDSVSGLQLLSDRSMKIDGQIPVEPGLIYIDGGHEYETAWADCHVAMRLFPGVPLVLDDCGHEPVERGAREAATDFGRKLIVAGWPGYIL